VDEGHAPDTGQAVDLDAALGEMREAFSVPLQEKGLELIVHSRPTGMQLKSNNLFLRLILFNLLDNAIQYTPRGRGPVSLEARKEGQTVRIAISDRGDGIPEHLQERIFQKWGRCERDEAAYSTGLGLYHAKTMTEALGGRIGVESLVGRGSTFWLKVPLA
jgi:two-component system phosphate regulon sensor histidine kinase PhoR